MGDKELGILFLAILWLQYNIMQMGIAILGNFRFDE